MTLLITFMDVTFPLGVVLSRIGRVFRISRTLRMMSAFPELALMLKGMVFAARSIVWGVLMILVTICFWSILAVLFIHPLVKDMAEKGYWADKGCERCPNAFRSVAEAMLTFCQQLVVGEGWSDVNTPVIEAYPWTAVYFAAVVVTTNIGVLNLLLGAIVERATEAKAVTVRDEAAKKDKDFEEAGHKLYDLCASLDKDQSGRLTYNELMAGFMENGEFSDILRVMDIDESDLEVVFTMLDADGSGDVAYEEFVEQLHMMKNHASHTLLIFIKFYVMEIRSRVNQALGTRGKPIRASTRPLGSPVSSHKPALALGEGHHTGVFQKLAPSGSDGQQQQPQQQQQRQHSANEGPAPSAAAGQQMERDIQKLEDIRRELLDFSRSQCHRLDNIQASFLHGRHQDREQGPNNGVCAFQCGAAAGTTVATSPTGNLSTSDGNQTPTTADFITVQSALQHHKGLARPMAEGQKVVSM
mmetsp:Transcript_45497/g.132460  ORF Transcript_45497/g.132460 Transcript_45497/m.132460 type:complete len:471 (+) Transcript_45497:3-1415(+)